MQKRDKAVRTVPLRTRGPIKTYAGYTRCDHCGVYDSDPHWCDLCARSKDSRKSPQDVKPETELPRSYAGVQ